MTIKKTFSKIAEVELVYKSKQKASEQFVIRSSKDAFAVLIETWDMNKIELQEQFRVILLDRKNSVMGVSTIATGGISDCMVDTKLVFMLALTARASAIIVAHNHPSGQKEFSEPDKRLTAKLSVAGQSLDLPVLDHLVVTNEGYISLADKGMLPTPKLQF